MATLTINNSACNVVVTNVNYGFLYNWYATSNAVTGTYLSNTGWRVPSYTDFETLLDALGAGGNYVTNTIGNSAKESGTTHWDNDNGVNTSGFTAVGSGNRSAFGGTFGGQKKSCEMWTSSTYSGSQKINAGLTNSGTAFVCNLSAGSYERHGKAVRLVKESTTLSHGQTGTYTGNDGKIYPTICIGTQEWIAVNLAETKYRDGTWINGYNGGVYTSFSNTEWGNLTAGSVCAYDDDESNALN